MTRIIGKISTILYQGLFPTALTLRVNSDSGEPASTESSTSSPVDMTVGDEEVPQYAKLPVIEGIPGVIIMDSLTAIADTIPNASSLVTMETVVLGGEGGEVVGGMSQHNGLPGYSLPRERQDSEVTLGAGELGPVGGEEEEDEDEEEDEEET